MNPLARTALWLIYYIVLAPAAALARWFDPLGLRTRGWREPGE